VLVDRRKAALLGVPQAAIVTTLRAGLAGENATWLHDSKYPTPVRCSCRRAAGHLDALLQLPVRQRGRAGAAARAGDVSDTCASSPSTTRTCCR
jgi:multidrug efflux pump subunit AcrB